MTLATANTLVTPSPQATFDMLDGDRLWQRLDAFVFDDPQAQFTFTQRLAREQGWSVGYAAAIVDEYRRFLYLAVTAGHEVTPSEQVDAAWHLHMIYTRSYWQDLCEQVLGQPLHHGPTRGGGDDRARFEAQYLQTLASYRKAFGHAPPADIWPSVAERFDRTNQPIVVDRSRYWIVPKPWHWLKMPRLFAVSATPVALAVVPIVAIANPLDLRGPEFLQFFIVLQSIAIAVALVVRHILRGGGDDSREPLDAYQAAYLADDVAGVVRAGVASLVQRGALEVVQAAGSVSNDYRIAVRGGTPADANELEQRIVAACGEPNGVRFAQVVDYAKPAAEKIGYRLDTRGLTIARHGLHPARWFPVAIVLLASLVGWAKLFVGIDRNKPVGFLVLLLLATIVIACFMLTRPHRTRSGDAKLREIRRQHRSLIGGRKRSTGLETADVALLAGVFGASALVGSELAPLGEAWKYRNGPPSDGGGGSGGGCGGGGDGGGGGGCGGGCGGCGG
jgi:uncharacterized protein (TIGR04222 family)